MRYTVREIQGKVAGFYGVTLDEMASQRRSRKIVRPRQIAMYLARDLTPQSMSMIGRRFGRDHTTVIHAIKSVDFLRRHYPDIDRDIKTLTSVLSEDAHQAGIRRSVESYAEAFA